MPATKTIAVKIDFHGDELLSWDGFPYLSPNPRFGNESGKALSISSCGTENNRPVWRERFFQHEMREGDPPPPRSRGQVEARSS